MAKPKTAGPKGQQPEALVTFAASARNDGRKPKDVGLEATEATKPLKTSPDKKQDAANKVLREGVLGKDQGADEAIDKLPDRTRGR